MDSKQNQEQLLQAIDDLEVAEQQLKNARDHYEAQEAREEILYFSQLINRLRSNNQ
jgi:hypothetical protein